MRALFNFVLAIALTANAPASIAASWLPLQGTFAVTPEHYLDPPDTEPVDSHFRIQLTGRTAKELFLTMKVPETKDPCTGAVQKQIGEMLCLYFKADSRYSCSFSINVMRQTIEHGVSC